MIGPMAAAFLDTELAWTRERVERFAAPAPTRQRSRLGSWMARRRPPRASRAGRTGSGLATGAVGAAAR